jgi:hypothetical protein
MKILILFISILLYTDIAAQKKPSPAEINKMKQRATEMQKQMQEAQKEIDELEKEDPEAAKIARQLLNQMHSKPSASIPKDAPIPQFSSPITSIKSPATLSIPSNAQANDNLLWYKGKLINDSMLITSKGNIILYSRKKNQIIVKPKLSADPFDSQVQELMKTEQRKKELVEQVAKMQNSFFYYPLIVNTLKEMSFIAQRYSRMLKNTIDLPPVNLPKEKGNLIGKGGEFLQEPGLVMEAIKKAYNETMAMKDEAPGLDFPVPPGKEQSLCFDCDIDKQATTYDHDVHMWDSLFANYESRLIRNAIGVMRMISLGWDQSQSEELKKMQSDMEQVLEFGSHRIDEKITLLEERYGNDYKRLPAVIEMIISVERQKQLRGVNENSSSSFNEKIATYIEGFEEYLRQEINNKNYNLVFNMPFILGMERQKQLTGNSVDNNMEYIDLIKAFNRFKLEMSIDFEVQSFNSEGELTLSATGQLKQKDPVYVSMGRNDCKYQLHLTNTNYGDAEEKEYRIPLEILGGIKKMKNNKGEFVSIPYSGPGDMYGIFPTFRIDFCDNAMDSVYLEMPVYQQELGTLANSAGSNYTIDFMAYLGMVFFNVKDMEGKIPDIESIGKKMMANFGGSPQAETTGYASLDKMQEDYNISREFENQQLAMASLTTTNKILFLFDAKNNNSVLVDETNNAAKQEDKRMKVSKANIHIKIVHAPLEQSKPKRKPLVKQ